MEKLFNTVGVSTLCGVVKVRFANGMAKRESVLKKKTHTAIRLVEIGSLMTKREATEWLKGHNEFQDAETQAVIDKWLARA
jgi:hypothetical protein